MNNIDEALDLVILNTQLDTTCIDDVLDILEERKLWLIDSKGMKNNTIWYRPYYVCAWHFWLLPENNLIKGESAQFDQNYEVTRRFLMMQRVIDIQNNLDIPVAYTVDTLLGTLNKNCQKCDDNLTTKPKNILSIMGF